MDEPYVRQYLEDREISGWFLLDLSPSVDFGTTQSRKRDQLLAFVTVLSRLLTRHGNRVGVIAYGDRVETPIPPASGRRHVLRIVHELERRQPLPSAPFTALGDLLVAAVKTIRRRSLLFIVSDFISAPGWEAPLALLARRHEVIAVRLIDPRESELPDIGGVYFNDAETGEQLFIDTHDERFRRRFADAARAREQSLAATFARAGVAVLPLSTEDDLVAAVLRFAMARKRARAATRAVGVS
jgi:uncharacterized protein (DUF58 family)